MPEERPLSHLVVVGSSASGIEALSEPVSTLPEDFSAPMVVIQHLHPERESHLESILECRSTLPVGSVAEMYGDRLIAVVLTGTGSDGTAGAHTVKKTGGTVIIQNPGTAAHPDMPRSLAPNTVNIVADLGEIGAHTHRLRKTG